MKISIFLIVFIKITMCEYDRRIITTLKYSKHRMVPTIVNGEPAAMGQMPYLVSIKESSHKLNSGKTVWLSLCGATILSPTKVITAAHCFEGKNFYFAKNPHKLRLVAGNLQSKLIHSGMTETNDQGQWRTIKKLKLHHDFVFPDNDIALVYVASPWNFTQNVNYAVHARRATDYPRSCHSAGFGRTGHILDSSTLTSVLLRAPIYIMSRWQCSAFWEMDMKSYICSESVVTDVGVGDSGGPLACRETLDPAEVPGRDLLVGVVSGKNFDKTTLYTRVSRYSDWIDSDANTGFKFKGRLFLIIITFLILKYLLFH